MCANPDQTAKAVAKNMVAVSTIIDQFYQALSVIVNRRDSTKCHNSQRESQPVSSIVNLDVHDPLCIIIHYKLQCIILLLHSWPLIQPGSFGFASWRPMTIHVATSDWGIWESPFSSTNPQEIFSAQVGIPWWLKLSVDTSGSDVDMPWPPRWRWSHNHLLCPPSAGWVPWWSTAGWSVGTILINHPY